MTGVETETKRRVGARSTDCVANRYPQEFGPGLGDPVKEILRHAEEDAANLIVMGSRGLGDLQGLLMGSVSHKVSQLSPCSCITVK